MSSDTPRADAAVFDVLGEDGVYTQVVDPDFARQIERELAEGKRELPKFERFDFVETGHYDDELDHAMRSAEDGEYVRWDDVEPYLKPREKKDETA